MFVCLLQKQCHNIGLLCITTECLKYIHMNIIHKDGFWSVIHLHKYCVAAPGRNAKAESVKSPFSLKRSTQNCAISSLEISPYPPKILISLAHILRNFSSFWERKKSRNLSLSMQLQRQSWDGKALGSAAKKKGLATRTTTQGWRRRKSKIQPLKIKINLAMKQAMSKNMDTEW